MGLMVLSEVVDLDGLMENARELGIKDAQAGKKGNPLWEGRTPEFIAYIAAYSAQRAKKPFTQKMIDEIVKGSCGCLTWDRLDFEAGLTDKELFSYLEIYMGISGHGSPCTLSVSSNGSGLRIWAGWSWFHLEFSENLISQGMDTVKRARRIFDIKDPSSTQILLF
ncbi:MAG: hypothetical protein V7776_22705 [Halopseudomonas aestusnigri]